MLFHVFVNVTGTLLTCPKVPPLPLTVQLGRRLSLAQVVYGPSRLVSIKPGLQHCLLYCAGAFPSILFFQGEVVSMRDNIMIVSPLSEYLNAIFSASIHGLKLTLEKHGSVSFQQKFKSLQYQRTRLLYIRGIYCTV